MKILVVDDEQLLVKGIKFNLENEGYQVLTAYDGAAAVELARREPLDLIILDLMMPQLSGSEACMKIREFSDVPIIMLTARSEGPQTESLSPLLPEGFQMLTVRVESGTCYLNLPRSDVSLLPEGLEAQQLLVRGLVNSLCSANGVDRVQLLLDGQVAASFGQVDISGPLYRE